MGWIYHEGLLLFTENHEKFLIPVIRYQREILMEDIKIDPWSSTDYKDYSRLRKEFGIQEFALEDWKQLPDPPMLFRRGVIFGHRDFSRIASRIKKNESWALMTGLMPSGRMHLGHKMVIDQVIYYQSVGADVFIGIADIEAFATRGYSLEEAKKLALEEYVINYIALGLKPCKIYFQSQQNDVKDLGYLLAKKANWSEVTAIYGFTGSTNMSHIFSPFIQCGDILHVQMMKYGGARPTLVPVGVDQDPHIRFTRGIAQAHRLFNVTVAKDGRPGVFVKSDNNISKLLDLAEDLLKKMGYHYNRITEYKALYIKDDQIDLDAINDALAGLEQKCGGYGFLLPSSTYHRFMTGLTGDKMSSSRPQTAIFLTDTAEDARKKIQVAKTGGAVTLEEQKKHGGNPQQCVIYELFLYHLIQDDLHLKKINEQCRNGEQRCGDCKSLACNLITTFLEDLDEKREKAKGKIGEYITDG